MEHDPLAAFYPSLDRWLLPVLEEFGADALLGPKARVLELGCGRGRALFWLQQRYPDCSFTGIDRDRANIATANELAAAQGLAQVSFVCADVTTSWTVDPPWTIILLCLSLHDLGPLGPAVVRDAHRRLAAGGRIILIDIPEYLAEASGIDAAALLTTLGFPEANIRVHRAEHVVTAFSDPRRTTRVTVSADLSE